MLSENEEKANEMIVQTVDDLFKKYSKLETVQWGSSVIYDDSQYYDELTYISCNGVNLWEMFEGFSGWRDDSSELMDELIKKGLIVPFHEFGVCLSSFVLPNDTYYQAYRNYARLKWDINYWYEKDWYFLHDLFKSNFFRIEESDQYATPYLFELYKDKCVNEWVKITEKSPTLQKMLCIGDIDSYYKKMVNFLTKKFIQAYKQDCGIQAWVEMAMLFQRIHPYLNTKCRFSCEYFEDDTCYIPTIDATREQINIHWFTS